jgi:hypothetical protein
MGSIGKIARGAMWRSNANHERGASTGWAIPPKQDLNANTSRPKTAASYDHRTIEKIFA